MNMKRYSITKRHSQHLFKKNFQKVKKLNNVNVMRGGIRL